MVWHGTHAGEKTITLRYYSADRHPTQLLLIRVRKDSSGFRPRPKARDAAKVGKGEKKTNPLDA